MGMGNAQPNPPLPNAEYKKLLLKGADQWRLPADYVEKLKQVKTEESPVKPPTR
jgi:hypothetical protein